MERGHYLRCGVEKKFFSSRDRNLILVNVDMVLNGLYVKDDADTACCMALKKGDVTISCG